MVVLDLTRLVSSGVETSGNLRYRSWSEGEG